MSEYGAYIIWGRKGEACQRYYTKRQRWIAALRIWRAFRKAGMKPNMRFA